MVAHSPDNTAMTSPGLVVERLVRRTPGVSPGPMTVGDLSLIVGLHHGAWNLRLPTGASTQTRASAFAIAVSIISSVSSVAVIAATSM